MRFDGDYDEDFPGQWALWERALDASFSSKRGQANLRRLRDAMLALPEPKLIYSRLVDEVGGVCAIGALVVQHRVEAGDERAVVMEALAPEPNEEEFWSTQDVEQETLRFGLAVGLTKTMAIEIAYVNDDMLYEETPEARYTRVMRWLDAVILDEVPA